MIDATLTVYEVAERLRCGPRKVAQVAKAHQIGANLEGRAGWRFTEADVHALWETMRPEKAVTVRRKRRAS